MQHIILSRKFPTTKKLQQIASSHSSHVDFKDFLKLYKEYTKEPYSISLNNTVLSSDNPLRFRKHLL